MPPNKKAAAVAEQQPTTTRSSRSKTKAAAEALLGAESSVANSKPTAKARGRKAGASSGSPAMSKTNELSPTPPKVTKKAVAKKATEGTRTAKEVEPAPKATKVTRAPTKKVTNGKAKIPAPARTTPPTESSTEPENIKANSIFPTNNSTEAAKEAKLSTGIMRKRTRDAAETDAVNGKEVVDTKHKKAKTTPTTTTTTSGKRKVTRKYTPFTFQNVEAWFEMYQDEEKDQLMSPAACNQWLEILGISAESAAFYVLAWKLGAKTIFSLTREEFVGGMKKLEIDSNEKLLDLLPIILDQVSSSFDSLDFKSFYKFCFNYGKSGGPPTAKNVELPIAIEFLKVVLDKDRYRIDYTPPTSGTEEEGGKKMEGAIPHLYAFIEFLQKAAKLKVINRDQWESFLPFNKNIGWGLEGYSEDSAWPSLFDEYAEWRKKTYPETVVNNKEEEQTDQCMANYAQ
ncbi:Cullin binding-domain-containing protein [Terfezia claveryi]|nr:Cullin binding-domain-containing protein [Terfezia claveryi]